MLDFILRHLQLFSRFFFYSNLIIFSTEYQYELLTGNIFIYPIKKLSKIKVDAMSYGNRLDEASLILRPIIFSTEYYVI